MKKYAFILIIFLLASACSSGGVSQTSNPETTITISKLTDGRSTVTIPLSVFGEDSTALTGASIDVYVNALLVSDDVDPATFYFETSETVVFDVTALEEGDVIELFISLADGSLLMFRATASETADAEAAPITAADVARTWSTPVVVDTGDEDAILPHVAINDAGQAVVVWTQENAGTYDLMASYYSAGSATWDTTPTLIVSGSSYPRADVALDSAGNVFVIWTTTDGIDVLLSRYIAGTGWDVSPTTIDEADMEVGSPQIEMDGDGNAMALWMSSGGSFYARRYAAESGWETTIAHLGDGDNDYSPSLAMNADGTVFVSWCDGNNAYATRYVAGIGWDTAATNLGGTDEIAYNAQVAVNTNGNAVVVWWQYRGDDEDLYANRYALGTGWETEPSAIHTLLADVEAVDVAMDAGGNAIATWEGDAVVSAIRYDASVGWDASPTVLSSDWSPSSNSAHVVMSSAGNALIAFGGESEEQDGLLVNEYTLGTGWESIPSDLDTTTVDANSNQIAMNSAGDAIAAWAQSDGVVNNIYVSMYLR